MIHGGDRARLAHEPLPDRLITSQELGATTRPHRTSRARDTAAIPPTPTSYQQVPGYPRCGASQVGQST